MVVVECSVPHCEFKTLDVSEDLAIALLTNHGLAHQNTSPTATASAPEPVPQGPKLDRPKVNVGVSTEEWNIFVRRWEVFRAGSRIDESSAPAQLFQCAGPELGDSNLKAKPDEALDSLPQLLENMRSLAVIPSLPVFCAPSCYSYSKSKIKLSEPSLLEYEVKPKRVPSLLFVNVGKALTIRTTPYGMSY